MDSVTSNESGSRYLGISGNFSKRRSTVMEQFDEKLTRKPPKIHSLAVPVHHGDGASSQAEAGKKSIPVILPKIEMGALKSHSLTQLRGPSPEEPNPVPLPRKRSKKGPPPEKVIPRCSEVSVLQNDESTNLLVEEDVVDAAKPQLPESQPPSDEIQQLAAVEQMETTKPISAVHSLYPDFELAEVESCLKPEPELSEIKGSSVVSLESHDFQSLNIPSLPPWKELSEVEPIPKKLQNVQTTVQIPTRRPASPSQSHFPRYQMSAEEFTASVLAKKDEPAETTELSKRKKATVTEEVREICKKRSGAVSDTEDYVRKTPGARFGNQFTKFETGKAWKLPESHVDPTHNESSLVSKASYGRHSVASKAKIFENIAEVEAQKAQESFSPKVPGAPLQKSKGKFSATSSVRDRIDRYASHQTTAASVAETISRRMELEGSRKAEEQTSLEPIEVNIRCKDQGSSTASPLTSPTSYTSPEPAKTKIHEETSRTERFEELRKQQTPFRKTEERRIDLSWKSETTTKFERRVIDEDSGTESSSSHVTVLSIETAEKSDRPTLNFSRFSDITPIGRPPDSDEEEDAITVNHHPIPNGVTERPLLVTNGLRPSTDDEKHDTPVSQRSNLVEESFSWAGKDLDILEINLIRGKSIDAAVGIILAGSVDLDSNEIIVHRVVSRSLAEEDGRIRRGDRLLAIQKRSCRHMTPTEARILLKTPSDSLHLVLGRVTAQTDVVCKLDFSSNDAAERSLGRVYSESPIDVQVVKGVTGLGLSLEGGMASPVGDRPLTIKRIFKGGAADKTGQLKVGDQILSAGGRDLGAMTHLDAWQFLKSLPEGAVLLSVLPASNV